MRTIQFIASQFIATQLAHPSGLFGRYVMRPFLNRSTSVHNALVLEELAVGATDRVLEVGFGGAALLERIIQQTPEGFVAGVEISEEMLTAASMHFQSLVTAGRLELRRGSVESLPYPDAFFNKACSVNTVYFWPDLAAGLKEFSRVLRSGGFLALGFTSAEDIRRAGLDQHGFSVYSPDELSTALAKHGFRPGPLRSGSDRRGTYYALSAEQVN